MSARPLLWVCAPFATRNLIEHTQTDLAIRKAVALGWAPIFYPYILAPAGFDDVVPDQRDAALSCCVSVIQRCDAFLSVGARMTPGMLLDVAAWKGRASFKWPDLPPAPEKRAELDKQLGEDTKLVKRLDSFAKGLSTKETQFVSDMVMRVLSNRVSMTPEQRRWAERLDEERVS